MNTYQTNNVCSSKIHFDVVDNKVLFVTFENGCDGNLKGISSLIQGMDVDDAISRLKKITCGSKTTSCPDQLAQALIKYQSKK